MWCIVSYHQVAGPLFFKENVATDSCEKLIIQFIFLLDETEQNHGYSKMMQLYIQCILLWKC